MFLSSFCVLFSYFSPIQVFYLSLSIFLFVCLLSVELLNVCLFVGFSSCRCFVDNLSLLFINQKLFSAQNVILLTLHWMIALVSIRIKAPLLITFVYHSSYFQWHRASYMNHLVCIDQIILRYYFFGVIFCDWLKKKLNLLIDYYLKIEEFVLMGDSELAWDKSMEFG